MSATRVKICGITRPDDGVAAAELGAWAVGFVFHERSPRHVTPAWAARIAELLPRGVLRVGVFLDAEPEHVREVEAELALDLVQLHGDVAARTLRAVGPERVILAASLLRDEDVDLAAGLGSIFVLLDHDRSRPVPARGTTDWGLAERVARRRCGALLAGGLTDGNVEGAVRRVRPWGVDVSRGVEAAPGVKCRRRMRRFIDSVRRADAS